jgi:hypothetical protein
MRSNCSSRFLLILILCLGLVTPAWARPGDREAEFERQYKRGVALYKAEKYQEAVEALQAAYAIKQLPRLLLNLGQAHRKLGHAREALGYYEFYLRVEPNPRPEIKTELDGYIAQTRAMLDAAERAQRESVAATERAAAERAAAERTAAEREAAERQAAERQAAERQAAERQAAERQAAERRAAERQAAERAASERTTRMIQPENTEGQVSAQASQPESKSKKKTWVWVGVGIGAAVLVAGAVTLGVVLGTRSNTTLLPLESAR